MAVNPVSSSALSPLGVSSPTRNRRSPVTAGSARAPQGGTEAGGTRDYPACRADIITPWMYEHVPPQATEAFSSPSQ